MSKRTSLDSETTETKENPKEELEIKLYGRRWIIIGLYLLYSAANAINWVQYSIITNIIMKYYGVSSADVEWTSLIAMILYAPLLLPACYIIDKVGLRWCALLGVSGTALGAFIKIFTAQPHPHLFWLGFTGQTVIFVFQPFILSLPPKIASVWFGPNEVSTACAMGLFGTLSGTALGFLLPPLIVGNHDNLEDIGRELSHMFNGYFAYTACLVILVFIFFKAEPPHPSSKAQAQLRLNKVEFNNKEFLKSYKSLLTNKPFLLFTLSFGMNIGVLIAIATLLNQLILAHFENAEKDAGAIGMLLILTGLPGVMVFGVILDRTKKFKETILGLYTLTGVITGCFILALKVQKIALVYLSACALGFFQNALYGSGFEFGVELSYPQPESSSSGILVSMANTCGVVFTLIVSRFTASFGTIWALTLMLGVLALGLVLVLLTPNRLMRQQALGLTPDQKAFLPKI